MKSLLLLAALAGTAGLAPTLVPVHGSASTTSPAAATYSVDPGHSAVIFRCKHLGVSQSYGRFNDFSGEVVFDPEDLSASSIRVEIKAESIDTNSAQRDQHLRSPDFFSAKEFPTLTFESKKVTGDADALMVEGQLTLHGTTKPVQAKASVVGSADTMFGDFRSGFVAEFTIDMRDFGLDFVAKNPGAVGPEVDVTVSLECIRQ